MTVDDALDACRLEVRSGVERKRGKGKESKGRYVSTRCKKRLEKRRDSDRANERVSKQVQSVTKQAMEGKEGMKANGEMGRAWKHDRDKGTRIKGV